MRKASQT